MAAVSWIVGDLPEGEQFGFAVDQAVRQFLGADTALVKR